MPPLQSRQFWKANPNQLALPGLEEHAHAGANLLAQGAHFKAEHVNEPGEPPRASLYALSGDNYRVGELHWLADDVGRGEIGLVETHQRAQRNGVASALYGLGRQMARVKPQHSPDRTEEGDAWAQKVTKKYGGKVPPLRDGEHTSLY